MLLSRRKVISGNRRNIGTNPNKTLGAHKRIKERLKKN
jgi:hypothetical protein